MRQVVGQIMRRLARATTPLRFAVAASAVLLALAPARAQNFPDQPIRMIVPTPGRRHGGYPHPRVRPEGQGTERRDRRRRKQDRRQRRAGGGLCREIAGERPDRSDRFPRHPGGAAASRSEAAIQAADRFRPGGLGRLGALRAGGASVIPGEDRQGVRRDREAETGRLQLRLGRLRHHASSRRRAVQDRGRGRSSSASPIGGRRPPTRTSSPATSRSCSTTSAMRWTTSTPEMCGRWRSPRRSARRRLPEVPTMAEAGVPNVVVSSWFALFVPAGTPKEAIAWLNKQANDAFSAPEVREQFASAGRDLAARHARGARRPGRRRIRRNGARWSARPTSRCRNKPTEPRDIMSHQVHLVGSVPLPDARAVFATVSAALGPHLKSHSRRRDRRAARLDHLARAGVRAASGVRAVRRDIPASRRAGSARTSATGSRPARRSPTCAFDNIFYADNAIKSYAVFAELKRQGVIPAPVKFQVDLVPAHSVIWLYVQEDLHAGGRQDVQRCGAARDRQDRGGDPARSARDPVRHRVGGVRAARTQPAVELRQDQGGDAGDVRRHRGAARQPCAGRHRSAVPLLLRRRRPQACGRADRHGRHGGVRQPAVGAGDAADPDDPHAGAARPHPTRRISSR